MNPDYSLVERHGHEDTICSDGGPEHAVTLWSTFQGVRGYETATLTVRHTDVLSPLEASYELDRREAEALRDSLTALLEGWR